MPTDAALELRDFMSELSEDHYCAGWLIGTERILWDAMHGGRRSWGIADFTDADIDRLRKLHNACGGWWYWPESVGGMVHPNGPLFVTTEEWLPIYATPPKVYASPEDCPGVSGYV